MEFKSESVHSHLEKLSNTVTGCQGTLREAPAVDPLSSLKVLFHHSLHDGGTVERSTLAKHTAPISPARP